MWLTVNGETRQKGTTRNMVFGVAHLVWYCSQFFVLEPGDVIVTGTPPGVGSASSRSRNFCAPATSYASASTVSASRPRKW